MKLYHFSKSSASLRLRIALAVKGVRYGSSSVSLALREHLSSEYGKLHPQNLVPALEDDAGTIMIQSLPIIEYLDEVFPEPALLPAGPGERSYVRAIAQIVACEIHPLNNMRVTKHLRDVLHVTPEVIERDWTFHWLTTGFHSLETYLTRERRYGRFCAGEQFTLADICLYAQVFSARRFGFSIEAYKCVEAIAEQCEAVPEVVLAKSVDG